ncbi:MAG: TonB-dependent receptor [Bacteroidota bacterium]
MMVFGISFLYAKEIAIYVKDAENQSPIADAMVEAYSEAEGWMKLGTTDSTGKSSFQIDEQIESFRIFHMAYEPLFLRYLPMQGSLIEAKLQKIQYKVDEVVLSASRFDQPIQEVPYQISVISEADISFQNPQTSADLLAQNGQVFVQRSQQGGGSPNLRGFEANKVLLVIDGVRMNNAIYRSGHLQNVITIDPDMLAQAEVLFGPASVVYGSDALGGVMHFSTRNPSFSSSSNTQVSGNISMRYGSVNQEKRIHADVNIGGEKWAWLGSVSMTDFGDMRSGSRPQWGMSEIPEHWLRDSLVVVEDETDRVVPNENPFVQSPSGYQQLDIIQKLAFRPSGRVQHVLNLQLSTSTDIPRYDRLTQTRDGRLRYAEWYYGPQTRIMGAYHLTYDKAHRFWDQMKLVGAYQYIEESRHSRHFQVEHLNQRKEKVHVGSINIDAQKKIAPQHQLLYGFEWVSNWVGSEAQTRSRLTGEIGPLDTRYPNGGTYMQSIAFYAKDSWRFHPEWRLNFGTRWTSVLLSANFNETQFYDFSFSQVNQFHQAWSTSTSVVYTPRLNWSFSYLNGVGFRAPNLDDVAKVFDSQPGNVIVPNPDLEPEYTNTHELSARYKSEHIQLEVGTFFTAYRDAIVLRDFQVDGRDSILYEGQLSKVQANVNAQEALLLGGYMSVKIQGKHLELFQTLNYTYGDVLHPFQNIPLDHIPPLFGKGQLNYLQPRWKASFEWVFNGEKGLNRYSPRDEGNISFATAEGSPAWMIFNVKATYRLGERREWQAGVENLLDTHYRPYSSRISAPGRNFYTSLKFRF